MPLDPPPRVQPPQHHRASWARVAFAIYAVAASVALLFIVIMEAPEN